MKQTLDTFETSDNLLKQENPASFGGDSYAHLLDDVMEIIDIAELKAKLRAVENEYIKCPNELNKARLGLIYHETALNLTFFSKTEFSGYAKKSFDILNDLANLSQTTAELMPYLTSYRASALSLVGAETKKLNLLTEAFKLFETAIKSYAEISYLPEFLRGSVAENLPWYFFSKKKFAAQDFESISSKYCKDKKYANWKIMSFVYLSLAKQQSKKHRNQSLTYLNLSISLDPHYKAARTKSEEMKMALSVKTVKSV